MHPGPAAPRSTAKRCRDKHLEEALQLARTQGEELRALGEAELRALLRCVLAFQLEAAGSSSAFQKLEQIVTQLATGREAVLAQEVGSLLAGLVLHGEVLSSKDLQAVCMFIEESSLGRQHWQQNMAPLLQHLAHTLGYVLQGQPAPSSTQACLAVKACLQLFQALPKDVAPLMWSTTAKSKALQSILRLLLEAVAGKALSKDVRLLAGTALSMLLNTAPEPGSGASAALTLFQLMDRGAGELRIGELVVEAYSIPETDGLERLALSRGLLTCCRADILRSRLEGSTCQACLLLDVLFPTVCTLSKEQKDYHYHCFQVLVLWLRRVQENLRELWHLRGSRLLAEDAKLLQELTQLVWDNAEAPVEGVSEFIHSSFRLLLEVYHLECQHFEDQERPLYQQMLQRAVSMPWQIKARYVPLCAIVPYVGSQQVLDACPMLPQHLLSCLATNHLCPVATELYRALLPAAGTLLATQFDGGDAASLRAWAEAAARLQACLRAREEGLLQAALRKAIDFVEWLLQLCISSLTPWANYQRKKTALLLLTAILETCTDTWSPERKKGQPPRTMATLLTHARQSGCWDFFSQPNLLALLGCLQDSTNEIRDMASELLIRYFPPAFPETLTPALLQLAQDTLSSPRVQEAEAGAVLMKTILQKSDSNTLKLLALETDTAQTLTHRSLYIAQHLLRVLQAQLATAQQNLLQAAATAPMHGVLAALRRCLLQVPEAATCMHAAESAQGWQELLSSLVGTAKDITSLLLGALQCQQGPGAEQQDMGNAIGSLIMLGKGQQEEEEDAVLLSEEHSLILTCCWVSVKEIGLLLGGLTELLLSSPGAEHLLPLTSLQTAATVFQEILLRCRHWGAVEGCSMGFTKFCAALLNHPDTELQAIPQTILDQTLLALATMALPQDWDQTLDLPQLQPGPDDPSSPSTHFLEPLLELAGSPIYAVRAMAAKALVPMRALLAPTPSTDGPTFMQSIWDAISTELGNLTPGREPGCAELQVGVAVLHQTMARFACSEAARVADSESIHTVCSLLRHPHPDVHLAVLSWVTDGKGAECKELERALRLTLLENLQSVLRDRGNKEFLRLYLEALMHLCRNCPSWSQEASQKLQGSALLCVDTLLLVMETEHPGPELLSQALCAASLLLTVGFGDGDSLLLQRWCVMLEECGRPVADEVLRLAAACSLQTAGTEVLQRCWGAACPWLVPVALRVINVSIHLLQDEDPDVRHEAAGFASLVQCSVGQQGGDGCIFVQGNVGLLGLLQLLLDEFGHHPETFGSLLQHLPQPDLKAIVEDLEADSPPSLYKEDEPNVFAEPAALAQQLLPFLLQLLEKAPSSALPWLQAAGPSVLQDLRYCQQRWSHGSATRCWMKALGCAVLRAALAVLLELEEELALVQGLLAQHGLGPTSQQCSVLREQGEAHGDG
ncbi:hypothetical protein ASZ78_008773 [Callipepla squamata]|uniref:DUF2428 domain-containing protein n=1 Tax=Callipepla squamata TaxID=9009 RepID=A0A226NB17_CALSU|nr:hypothetical protein ASZ78_008773 [Callipepla squamata]